MSLSRQVLVVGLTLAASRGVLASENVVTARSIGVVPNAEVVAFVAANAEPTVVDVALRKEAAGAPARRAIEETCGMVHPAYVSALGAANGVAQVDLDAPLGALGTRVVLPACLYATTEVQGARRYTVKQGDTLTEIRRSFTGAGAYVRKALAAFYSETEAGLKHLENIKPGDQVFISTTTATTLLEPRSGSSDEFAARLRDVGGKAVSAEADPPSPGEIIGQVRFSEAGDAVGATQGAFASCEAGDASRPYPFDGAEVAAAFKVAKSKSSSSTTQVSVVVVDNGFFGVACSGADCPDQPEGQLLVYSPRFPAAFFNNAKFESTGFVGPVVKGTNLDPVNYFNAAPTGQRLGRNDVNPDSAHGTHVAGLAIGGPYFEAHRGAFYDAGSKPWLTLLVANLSGGRRELRPGVDRNLAVMLARIDGPKIVNMSLAFNGAVDQDIAKTLRGTMVGLNDTLFVAAAGNSGKSLESSSQDIYPARLGGIHSSNVVTVGSVDGPVGGSERLSTFSGRSALFVDLLAPGCQIRSWLDAERAESPMSGTSQAAPIVTFAAALLRSLWHTSPAEIKNRLLYSGTLLPGDDADLVRSKASLSIPKALLFPWDQVTFVQDGRTRTLLGDASLVQGLACVDGDPVAPAGVRAVKRRSDQRLAIYRVDSNDFLQTCWGLAGAGVAISFRADRELVGGQWVPSTGVPQSIAMDDIRELIRKR